MTSYICIVNPDDDNEALGFDGDKMVVYVVGTVITAIARDILAVNIGDRSQVNHIPPSVTFPGPDVIWKNNTAPAAFHAF